MQEEQNQLDEQIQYDLLNPPSPLDPLDSVEFHSACDGSFVERAYYHLPLTAELAEAAAKRNVSPQVRDFALRLALNRRAHGRTAAQVAQELALGIGGRRDQAQPALQSLKADILHVKRDAPDKDVERVFFASLLDQDQELGCLTREAAAQVPGSDIRVTEFASILLRALQAETFEARKLATSHFFNDLDVPAPTPLPTYSRQPGCCGPPPYPNVPDHPSPSS
jgi:hypothetical protein